MVNKIVDRNKRAMNKIENLTLIWLFVLLFMVVCSSCSYNPMEQFNDWAGLSDDNVLEEAVEFVVEHESGLDVDLTPRSPE